ncbi:UNVERIFIED_CONTAM: putative ribonuclease H protein [Sesamum radiatum]|uniref:Ribonuclease H protein n=1 Tax=Sesamum radiatum TaxID=300843 RepID=A0AAW2JBC5_SESRA
MSEAVSFSSKFITWIAQCLTTVSFSISLNGSVHGFFAGARGLRQGDPMSPYLFVLVMELFHALLKFRIRTDGRFQHHWKCEDLNILNLGFADDVLLFCAGHVESVRSIKNILAEFEDMSGLKVNPNKSSIILSKAVRSERQEILEVLGFQEGSLPIKYLGVPLTASRLTIADCQPLLDKVSSRISGWSHLSLSFAGRVQVIKSVLSALHMYWGSVFILPKAVIKVLERRMTDFLWKGPSGAGYTKVAWVQCCKPKEEGGLGIRSVQYINQALILKQIWRILQQEPRSIWVAWVLRYRLRNQTVWTFSSASAPWFWRKMLKLCPRLKEGLEYRVGDGRKFRLWSDIWHPRGPLLFTFPRGPCITGLPADSMLHQVIHQDQWHWPAAAADFDIQEIVAGLPSIYSQQPDEIKWKSNSGMCTTSAILSLLQPSSPHVEWHHLLRGKFKIPRHGFILWLAFLERLSTMDRIWVPHSHTDCVLCGGVRFKWLSRSWQTDISWASGRWRNNHLLNEASRAMLAAMVYYIWRERNSRRFANTSSSAEAVTSRAIEEVRNRILSVHIRPSLQLSILYRVWGIH